MNGVRNNVCLHFVHDFHGLEKMDVESKEVFSSLVMFSKKLALDLQEMASLNSLLWNMMSSEDLMELEAQRKDEERQDEEDVVEEPERFMIQEMARGLSLFEEVLLVFEALVLFLYLRRHC